MRPNYVNTGIGGGKTLDIVHSKGVAGPESQRKTALIVEGGAMRRAWAAGVLAFLHETARRQFDLVYAASSGACTAAYFVAGLWEPGLTIWREFASKVVRKTNFLHHKPVIDLAYLVDHTFRMVRVRLRSKIRLAGTLAPPANEKAKGFHRRQGFGGQEAEG